MDRKKLGHFKFYVCSMLHFECGVVGLRKKIVWVARCKRLGIADLNRLGRTDRIMVRWMCRVSLKEQRLLVDLCQSLDAQENLETKEGARDGVGRPLKL